MQINRNKFALSFGIFAGVIHIIWSIVVALGFGQQLIDFIHSMHFMGDHVVVESFNFGKAVGLVVLAFFVGYIASFIFASVWNAIHKK